MDPTPQFEKLFGADDSGYIPPHHINHLLKLCWSGTVPSEGLRPICWRVLLGLVSSSDKSVWEKELSDMVDSYQTIKSTVMPSLDKVEVDPLSSVGSGASANDAWSIYYKNVDLINFVKTDLDRLYITGIADEHFESPERRSKLLAILLIWSFQHPVISYRQGMHEMAGYMLYCVEQELLAWDCARAASAGKSGNDPYGLYNVLTEANVEAHTYHLFVRVMNELEPLYDPVSFTPRGAENQPFIVQYSTKIQEHYLRMLDTELCMHLEECHVSAQIYGLRWCRLLLGREFSAENAQIFKLWDYIFACCYEAENTPPDALLDIDSHPNVNSVFASVRIAGYNQYSNAERRNISSLGTVKHTSANESSAPDVPLYVCTPLLGALGDLMLAMLLQIRDQLLESDSSTVLGYLMRYPAMPSVTPILDYADMIKRGVIMGPPVQQNKLRNPRKQNVPLRMNASSNSNQGTSNNSSGAPSPNNNLSWANLNGMKQKVAEKLLAMGNGISEIVNSIADYGEDPEPTPPAQPQPQSQPLASRDPLSAQPLNESSVRLVVKQDSQGTAALVGTASGNPNKFAYKGGEPTSTKGDSVPSSASSSAATSASASAKSAAGPAVAAEPSTAVAAAAPLPFDPLSGMLSPTEGEVAAAGIPPAPHSPILTGKGTGYKNMPASAVKPSEDRDPLSGSSNTDNSALNSPTITGYHIRTKIMKSGWFPASTSKKEHKSKRENRSSGGVDLHVLHSSLKAIEGQHSDQESSGPEDGELAEMKSIALKNKAPNGLTGAQKNAVGDRLLDLADLLVHPAYKNMPSTLTSGRELEYETELRRDTVKKLRAMADVLAGLITIDAYDSKFAATQPGAASPMRPSPVPASMAPTVGSPLPVVKEASRADHDEDVELPDASALETSGTDEEEDVWVGRGGESQEEGSGDEV